MRFKLLLKQNLQDTVYNLLSIVWSSTFMYKGTFISSLYVIVALGCFIAYLTMDYNTYLLIYLAGLYVSFAYGM